MSQQEIVAMLKRIALWISADKGWDPKTQVAGITSCVNAAHRVMPGVDIRTGKVKHGKS